MLTQCPSCQTTFRVTSEILRVADGQVRCGRCHTQFDALERLIEEGPPGSGESGRFLRPPRPAAKQSETSVIEVDEPDVQEDITLEGRHIEISGNYRVLDDADASGDRRMQQKVTEEWSEIDGEVEADAIDIAGGENAEDPAQHARELDDLDEAAAAVTPYTTRREPFFVGARHRASASRAAEAEQIAEDLEVLGAPPRSGRTSLKWKLLAAPLLLILVAQVVHHYRSDLARHPQIGASLMNLYGRLHLPLTPEWNLHAYEIKQWGVLSDPASPGTLKVRASITNRADFAQPFPLLKLMLEDRWGEQVRAREFEPAEYLDPGTSANRLLGAKQQANATINIVDPGPDAEGFRFDVCLRGRARAVCAAEIAE